MCVGREILLKVVLIFPRPPFLNISNEIMSGENQVVLSSFDNVKITELYFFKDLLCLFYVCECFCLHCVNAARMCSALEGQR